MRLFESRQEWLKAHQNPKLIILAIGKKKDQLENDLYERMYDNTPFSKPKIKRYEHSPRNN